ncbi:MAG: EF-P beta-lysylation protein EpmB [Gammaproteobacteria bacterium]|nr:EF-P beta-lysylation protein EpmB [Gammaproteobacteria bacterium]
MPPDDSYTSPPHTSQPSRPADNITRADDLCRMLGLPARTAGALAPRDCAEFPLKVPRAWLNRIRRGDAADPLLRQVLPVAAESAQTPGFGADAVGDLAAGAGNGILHKYRHRVLLVVTGACAIHCRYCFRRHFPYRGHTLAGHLDAAMEYIAARRDIEEVILSGGDPLTLANRKLFDLCERLEAVPHVTRIRIHTRLPVANPERMDSEWLAWSRRRPKPYLMVLHINHPAELDRDAARAVGAMRHWTLLNQAVLLKGVNDDAETLARLSRRCFEAGVLPYYLHLLDRVRGAAHFEVDEAAARRLMREVAARLPGYLVPKLARETPGAAAKDLIAY